MQFRKATTEDIDSIMQIFDGARKRMALLDIDQWQDGYPQRELIVSDIGRGESYVGISDSKIVATVMLTDCGEPDYAKIYDGGWLNGDGYLTIHRIALDSSVCGTGAAGEVMRFAEKTAEGFNLNNIRVDTHEGNLPMRRNLEKNGYRYCGVIYLSTGAKRVAYQKILEKKMKIKDGYILRKIADSFVAVAVGDNSDRRLVRLNSTGAFLWELLKAPTDAGELISALQKEYGIDSKTAAEAVDGFIAQLGKENLLA